MTPTRKAVALTIMFLSTQLCLAGENVGIHYMSEYAKKINRKCGWENDCDSCCYAWKPKGQNRESAQLIADKQDKTEGSVSYSFVLNHGWSRWVLEMKDGKTVDYSHFDKLVFQVKSSDAKNWDSFVVIIESAGKSCTKKLKDIGFKPDGQWHTCEIAIKDLAEAGVDTTKITRLFQIGWGGGVSNGHKFKLDDLHLVKGN